VRRPRKDRKKGRDEVPIQTGGGKVCSAGSGKRLRSIAECPVEALMSWAVLGGGHLQDPPIKFLHPRKS